MKHYLVSYTVIDGLHEYKLKFLMELYEDDLKEQEEEIIEDYKNDKVQERAVKDIEFRLLTDPQASVLLDLGF